MQPAVIKACPLDSFFPIYWISEHYVQKLFGNIIFKSQALPKYNKGIFKSNANLINALIAGLIDHLIKRI